jgi:hypothetical protein
VANLGATTLGQITLQAQQRADLVNSGFVTPSEWTAMVNASCQQLYEKLVEAYGSDYEVAASFNITTDGQNDNYALPTDFFKLLGVDLQYSPAGANTTSGWISIGRFNFADRNRYTLPNVQLLWGRTNLKYRLRGGNIWFIPLPMGGQTCRIWYAPRFTPLVNASDSFDGINGWEEWVVNDVAMKVLVKEESDISGIEALQQVQNDRLLTIIDNRDAGSPSKAVDVYGINGNEPWGGGGGSEDWSV